MSHVLNTEAVETYNENGILFPINILEEDRLVYYWKCVQELRMTYPKSTSSFRLPFLNLKWAYELATHPVLLDVVSSIIGDELIIAGGMILLKPARSSNFVSWHQDSLNHQFLGGGHSLSAWIALSESNPQSGCLRVVPKTHKSRLKHIIINKTDDMLRNGEVLENIDETEAVDLVLRPGEMSLHHMNIVHSSGPNISNYDRIGFIVRFTSPDIIQEENQLLMIAKGKKQYNHLNVITQTPTRNTGEAIRRQMIMDQQILMS